MKIILGGGLVALLARDILGSDWKLLPIGRSLYYSFNPPLADNFIIKDNIIDQYMDQFAYVPIYMKIGFSFGGQITNNANLCLDNWLYKVYGKDQPPHAKAYWGAHLEYFTYGDCCEIYRQLQDRYSTEIINNSELGKPTKISNHIITTSAGKQIEYDEIVSTIPYDALLQLLNVRYEMPANDIFYYHIKTDALDFEGNDQLLVADQEIEFFKAYRHGTSSYIFQATKEIVQPARYFMSFMKRFDLIGAVQVARAIPCGVLPDCKVVSDANISCYGSTASWDDCQDIGTCCKRLVKKANSRA